MEAKLSILSRVARQVNATLRLTEILDAIVRAADELVPCNLAEISLWYPERNELVLQALRCDPERSFPLGQAFPPGEGYTGWVVRHKEPLFVPDVAARQDIRPHLLPGEHPFAAYIGLPLLAGDDLIGTLVCIHEQAGAFDDDDLHLLEGLADQAAVAIRNARLYESLSRRHSELEALYQVAEAANRPLDLNELLQETLERVIEALDAQGGGIRLLDPQQQTLILAAHRGLSEAYVRGAERFPLSREIVGWVARSDQPTLSADMWTDERVSPEVRALLREVGHRSLAQVPLRAKDRTVGTLGVVAREPDFFNEDDLNLLNAIGQQLGMAIANAQLFVETQRKASRMAVLNEIAAVINQPLSLQEVMNQAVAKVSEVIDADVVGIRLLDPVAGQLFIAAYHGGGLSPGTIPRMDRVSLGEEQLKGLAQWREPLVVRDLSAFPLLAELAEEEALKVWVVVPLRAEDKNVGLLGVSSRLEREFSIEELDLLMAIGHQLGMAIANAQLFEETERRARRLAALNAVAAAINQSLDLETLLSSVVDQIIQVIGVDAAGVRLHDPQANTLNLAFSRGFSPEFTAYIQTYPLEGGTAARVLQSGEPALIDDMWADPPKQPQAQVLLEKEGLHARVEVPLCSQEQVVGTLGVVSRTPAAFGPEDVDLLTAIGHQLGVAIENTRLQQQVLDAERLAAVGRVASTVAHDMRSPLGGIMRSAEFLARPEISPSTRKKLSQSVVAMAHRLINTSQEILDFIRGERLVLQLMPIDLSAFLEEVIEVLRVDFSDRGIEVLLKPGDVGAVWIDPDRMAQVVYNIAANARDAMPEGGRLTITTRRSEGWTELSFHDTGPGVPVELAGRIFEPFVSFGKREGAGLGLSIARRIVEEHGGEIALRSSEGEGATFILRLPLAEEEN
jgi:GAF domain-containing protein